ACTRPSSSDTYPLSLHDALPILHGTDETALMVALDAAGGQARLGGGVGAHRFDVGQGGAAVDLGLTLAEEVEVRAVEDKDLRHRSEEHTSELQSRFDLVCRLLLE